MNITTSPRVRQLILNLSALAVLLTFVISNSPRALAQETASITVSPGHTLILVHSWPDYDEKLFIWGTAVNGMLNIRDDNPDRTWLSMRLNQCVNGCLVKSVNIISQLSETTSRSGRIVRKWTLFVTYDKQFWSRPVARPKK